MQIGKRFFSFTVFTVTIAINITKRLISLTPVREPIKFYLADLVGRTCWRYPFADQIRNHGYLETFLSPRIRENPLSIRNLNGERAKSPTVAIDLEKGRQEITLSTDFRKLRGGFRAEFKTVDEEARSAPEGGI